MTTVITAGFQLVNVFDVFDDATLHLQGTPAVTAAVIGGVPHLFVAGFNSGDRGGLSVFRVEADGSLVNTDNVIDNSFLAVDLAMATVDGVTYLFAPDIFDDGVSVFAVGNDGTLTNVDNVFDDATLELDGPFSVATAEAGGTAYLFAAGYLDNGVSVFRVENDGSLTNVDNVSDDATLKLTGARSLTTAEVGGVTYLFAAGQAEDGEFIGGPHPTGGGGSTDGVSVFRVENDGSLTNVDNVGDDATLQLQDVSSVVTAEAGGVTYLFAAGPDPDPFDQFLNGGVSVFRVENDGTLTSVFNLQDDFGLSVFPGEITLATATVNGVPLLFVASSGENTVSMFRIGDDGALDLLDANGMFRGGSGASDVATVTAGGVPYLFAPGSILDGTGNFQDGLSVLRIETPLAVTGTAAADTLVGGASGDLIAGLGGNDILDGGAGDDTLIGGDGFDTVTYASATGPVTVNLAAGTASGPDGNDTLESIERVIGGDGDDLLFGQNGRDSLIGGDGNDTLRGRSGNDVLRGQGDNDFLAGGNHNDQLFGDGGNDRLLGQNGNDTLRGGDGDDLLFGQNGGDRLFGDGGNDRLFGQNGDDFLIGGGDDDLLFGHNGSDRLIGGAGEDTLTGGRHRDVLTGGANRDVFDFNSLFDSRTAAANRDIITDFQRGVDVIDLRDIDARTGVADNQKFNWIGRQDFHDRKGELRIEDKGAQVIVQGDVNGDGKADFEILVKVGTLTPGDFFF